MKIRKVFIWSLITNEHHSLLSTEEKQIFGAIPVLNELFPGISYYHPSESSFHMVMKNYGVPALKKLFPDVEKLDHDQITKSDTLEIKPFLKSNGYEWKNDKNWSEEFNKLLAA